MTQETTPTISRRRLAAGAAWAVPAVTLAGAAPAMAASPTGTMSSGGLCEIQKSELSTNHQTRRYMLSVGPRPGETWKAGETWSYEFTVRASSPGKVIPDMTAFTTHAFGEFSSVTASPQVGDTRKFTFTWTSKSAANGGPICVMIGWSQVGGQLLDPNADIWVKSTSPAGKVLTVLDPGNQANSTYKCDITVTEGSQCCNWTGFPFPGFPCEPYLGGSAPARQAAAKTVEAPATESSPAPTANETPAPTATEKPAPSPAATPSAESTTAPAPAASATPEPSSSVTAPETPTPTPAADSLNG